MLATQAPTFLELQDVPRDIYANAVLITVNDVVMVHNEEDGS